MDMTPELMAKLLAEELLADMTAIVDRLEELYDRHMKYGPQYANMLPTDFRISWERDIGKQLSRLAIISDDGE